MNQFIAISAPTVPAEVAASLQNLVNRAPEGACPDALRQLRREVRELDTQSEHCADVGRQLQQVWGEHQALLISGFVFDHPDGVFQIDHLVINRVGCMTIYVSAHLDMKTDVSVNSTGVWEVRKGDDVRQMDSPIEQAKVLREKLTWVLQTRLFGRLPYAVDRNTVNFVVVIPDRVAFECAMRKPPVLRVSELGNEVRLRKIRSDQFCHGNGYDPENTKEVVALHHNLHVFARFALGDAEEFASNLLTVKDAILGVAGTPTPEYYLRKSGVVTGRVQRVTGSANTMLPKSVDRAQPVVQRDRLTMAI